MSKDTAAAIEAAKPDRATSICITLDTPLQRGAKSIDSITLRKPVAGELRGIELAGLLRLDVGSLQTLVPRISSPTLTAHDVAQLDPADLLQIGSEVVGFFVTKADRALLSPSA